MDGVTLDPGKIGIWTHQLDGVPSERARSSEGNRGDGFWGHLDS